ncbi:AbrB/MazE/SpoVT family DNA-binding domain-containing protein [uncultured Thiodictyon sp.]|jgi:AbrB family looped-hinge helix DNA binding protein|uniref:AbrB/MazE/SpoVT family DNA-binding domain-containing protein n=1 Tax=uncultured Thiodictyon sp. TaxID=1846217 RepID=UPI0025E6B7A8|nr:AbrB/MazE/SpoVT family DNA-binding domain-containing protein [uncultured Thiodictyon sp.]
MSSVTVTLSSRGQVEIPEHIRAELHWQTGRELILETTPAGLLLKPRPANKALRLEDLRGFLKHAGPPLSTDALCAPVDIGAEWDAAESHGQ